MDRRIINISIWLIIVIIFINVTWLFTFIVSSFFKLDTFIPRENTFHIVFISSSVVIVILAAVLNICLNLNVIVKSKQDANREQQKPTFSKRGLVFTASVFFVLTVIIFSIDSYKRYQNNKLIISRWTAIIQDYSEQVNEISESISDSSKIELLPSVLKDFAAHRIENPDMIVICSDTIKNRLEFIEIAATFSDADFYKRFPKPVIYKAFEDEREYLRKIFTSNSTEIYLSADKGHFRLFYPIANGRKKFILLFMYYEDIMYGCA